MKSDINHLGYNVQRDNNEIILEGIVAPFDMFVRIAFETGICGEDWSDYYFCHAGTDIDNWSWELAKHHAESYGHYEGEEDDEDGFDIANVCATVYWYSPEVSSAHINGGSPNSSIYALCVSLGAIVEGEYIPPTATKEIAELLYFENDGELRRFLAHK